MKNINESELRNYIFKKLQESYFDELEFDDEAMKAAMNDMKASGEEFEELGASKFEKDPKFKEKFTAALNRANLELPSDEDEVEKLAKMMQDKKSHEERFGVGSLNETEDDKEAYESSRYMFFSNLQQIRRQAGLLLDMDEDEIQEILENGHDWAQDHIATAKESIDQVFDFLMNETQSGDMWKSVDVEYHEDDEKDEEGIEEGMGLSHTVGKGTNEKPVNYPEELMRESIKNALSEAFANYTSTSANARPVSFSKATLTKQHSTLSAWIQKKYPNVIVKMEMPAKTVDKKNPDALKPSVYLWIPTNNQNVISVEYRNVPNAVNTAKLQTTEILKAYPTLVVADPLKVGKDATQATYSLTLKPEESKNTAPSTTAKPALAESFMKEDEYHTLSFLDKIKLKLAGVSEEKALENLNNGLPIDWTGSKEGYYDKEESKKNYSGTNEGLEDMDKTDYDFNERMLNYKKEEEARKELGDELVDNEDRYEQIVFLQDHEADHALNILMQDGEDDAMDYLMQWHQPGNHMTSEDAGFGSSDKTFERDGYTMAWNTSLGYISLVHDLDSSIDEDSQRKRHTAGQLGKVSKNIPLGQNAPHSDSAEEI